MAAVVSVGCGPRAQPRFGQPEEPESRRGLGRLAPSVMTAGQGLGSGPEGAAS